MSCSQVRPVQPRFLPISPRYLFASWLPRVRSPRGRFQPPPPCRLAATEARWSCRTVTRNRLETGPVPRSSRQKRSSQRTVSPSSQSPLPLPGCRSVIDRWILRSLECFGVVLESCHITCLIDTNFLEQHYYLY